MTENGGNSENYNLRPLKIIKNSHKANKKSNMYKKVTRMLKYLFRYCEEQENNQNEMSLVIVNLFENETQTQGIIEIDVDGPWLKQFTIRSFCTTVLKRYQEQLDFIVHHGNTEKNIHYKYTTKYNTNSNRTETILSINKQPIIHKHYYLRINIETTVEIVKNLFHKLKKFLKIYSQQYPSVTIQFHASSYTENKDSDEVNIKMITDSVGDVLKNSLNNEFRKNVHELFEADCNDWAVNKLYNHICNCIPDK